MAYWNGRAWQLSQAPVFVAAPPKPPYPTLPLAAAVGALIAVILPLIGSRLVTAALADLDWPIAVLVAISATIGYGPSLVWCWYATRRWGTGHFFRDIGLQARWSDFGWGPLTYLCCFGGQAIAGIVVAILRIPVESNIGEADDIDRTYVITILILAVIIAPIAEEIIFRGVVLRGFRSVMPAAPAVIAQAVIFGSVHFDPALGAGNIGLIIILSTVGGVLGGAAYLFRRIVPSMIAHGILNTIALTLALTGVLDRVSS
jgi:membrane protease YdiL (CAAX protease family)